MARLFLAIAGNIGSGKTTLTRLLSDRFAFRPYFESVVDNPYLADFYGDMGRWALPLQMRFLTGRARDHRRTMESSESAVQDRTIYEDAEIFAWNLHRQGQMDERDWKTVNGH